MSESPASPETVAAPVAPSAAAPRPPDSKKGPSVIAVGVKKIVLGLKALILAPVDPDAPTRRMAYLMLLAVAGVFWVATAGWREHREKRVAQEREAKELAEQAASLERGDAPKTGVKAEKIPMHSLGTFVIELTPAPKKAIKSVQLDVAEVEVVAECENEAVCELLEQRPNEARDAVVSAFGPVSRMELLSPDGKRRLKKKIMQRLNLFVIREGRVRRIFFGKLLVS